jgi:hypothetical protein
VTLRVGGWEVKRSLKTGEHPLNLPNGVLTKP